jgi:beta-galactosidase/beta-glucuronidase
MFMLTVTIANTRDNRYTLQVSVSGGDVQNTTFGIRGTKWTGDKGFFLNDQHVKIRGFCDHRWA